MLKNFLKIIRTKNIAYNGRFKEWQAHYSKSKNKLTKFTNLDNIQNGIVETNNERLQKENYKDYGNYLINDLTKINFKNKKIIELACGTAPMHFFLKEKLGIKIDCSDYSDEIVKRLIEDHNINAVTSNLADLKEIQDKTYDYVIVGGGFYEDEDPYFYKNVFKSLKRILKEDGKAIVIMNRYLNILNLSMYLKSIYFCKLNPKSWGFLRKIFKKKPLNKVFALYLYSVKFINKELNNLGFCENETTYVGLKDGLREFLNFYLNINNIKKEDRLIKIIKKLNLKKSFCTSVIISVKKN